MQKDKVPAHQENEVLKKRRRLYSDIHLSAKPQNGAFLCVVVSVHFLAVCSHIHRKVQIWGLENDEDKMKKKLASSGSGGNSKL